jgi:hypothetical protein
MLIVVKYYHPTEGDGGVKYSQPLGKSDKKILKK